MQAREADPVAETTARQQQVADLQERARGWFLVMDSHYWRRYIAIYRGHCDEGIILQAADPDALWQLMDRVAPPHWQADTLPHIPPARRSQTAEVLQELPAALWGAAG
ncbi:hypothetical protein [Nonomuraea sp. NPDC050202]|uniref:hypothetical protein n=1 Tax=Nonomuraea sp. NPDC050202 TaxID=3155035 RepID=UPI0033D734CD